MVLLDRWRRREKKNIFYLNSYTLKIVSSIYRTCEQNEEKKIVECVPCKTSIAFFVHHSSDFAVWNILSFYTIFYSLFLDLFGFFSALQIHLYLSDSFFGMHSHIFICHLLKIYSFLFLFQQFCFVKRT